jgi:hypothetical protein
MIKVDVCLSSSIQFLSFSIEINEGKRQVMILLKCFRANRLDQFNKKHLKEMMISRGDINHRWAYFLANFNIHICEIILICCLLSLTLLDYFQGDKLDKRD